jgi:hypothetical protein
MQEGSSLSSRESLLDPVACLAIGACLLGLAGWLVISTERAGRNLGVLEVSGQLEHVMDWRRDRRSPMLVILQISGSNIRVTTDRLSASNLLEKMRSSTVSVRAIVKRSSAALRESSPVVSALALWVDGVPVLTLSESESSERSSSDFAFLLAFVVSIPGLYFVLKAHALRRERVEA